MVLHKVMGGIYGDVEKMLTVQYYFESVIVE